MRLELSVSPSLSRFHGLFVEVRAKLRNTAPGPFGSFTAFRPAIRPIDLLGEFVLVVDAVAWEVVLMPLCDMFSARGDAEWEVCVVDVEGCGWPVDDRLRIV